MKLISTVLLSFCTLFVLGQNIKAETKKVDRKAFYYNGIYAMERVFKDSSILYNDSLPKNTDGVVIISTEILADGNIGQLRLVKSINEKYDAEAKRLVALLPDWRPAKIYPNAVSSYETIQVDFKDFKRPRVISNKFPEIVAASEDPEYPGGFNEMYRFIAANVVYPAESIDVGDEGKVYVRFEVGLDGELTNIKISKGVTKELDAEAIRVVKSMPNWIPGKVKGKKVRCFYTLPINFRLQ